MPRPPVDYKKPDYPAIFRLRAANLLKIRRLRVEDPAKFELIRAYYRDHPADFISDWGMTFDPRNIERGLPSVVPFALWPKQEEWIEWVVAHWKAQKPGLTEKSRDEGLSWLSVALSCTLCTFYDGMAIGFGSRKEEYVDKIGAPKSLFYKARMFMEYLPPEFKPGWRKERDAPYMRISFPATGSTISGEAGDNIGRGDRAAIYFVDEAPLIEHPESVDAALSQTTNCQIDIGTARGMGNTFAQKRHGGKIDVFTFHWRSDPRKDDEWYAKQVAEQTEVIVAQEIDINYSASVEGIVIPAAWARASKDAHFKLGIKVSGARRGSLDVADEGKDKNAFVVARGILVESAVEWSGKGSDPFATAVKAVGICDEVGIASFRYDADGLGASVRGDVRIMNEERVRVGKRKVSAEPYRGSGEVVDPDGEIYEGRTNGDFFANRKAQVWWSIRRRFELTYKWVVLGVPCDPDEIISLSGAMPLVDKLISELSQVVYKTNTVGKIVIDKAPDGVPSPNLADGVVMDFAGPGADTPIVVSDALLARSASPANGLRRRARLG